MVTSTQHETPDRWCSDTGALVCFWADSLEVSVHQVWVVVQLPGQPIVRSGVSQYLGYVVELGFPSGATGLDLVVGDDVPDSGWAESEEGRDLSGCQVGLGAPCAVGRQDADVGHNASSLMAARTANQYSRSW